MSISLFVYARWPDTLAMRMNCVPDPWPFEPKINRIRYTVNDYYCAKFLVIPVRGFRFFYHANIDITHPHTHIMTNLSQYLRRHTTSSAQIITLCILALMGMRDFAFSLWMRSSTTCRRLWAPMSHVPHSFAWADGILLSVFWLFV